MKIKFDTTSGVDTKNWECLLTVSCTPDGETPNELLAGGWLFDPITLDWYMSRSVRIDLSKWSASESEKISVSGYDWFESYNLDERDLEILKLYRQERRIINYPYNTFERCGPVRIEKGRSSLGDCWYMTVQLESSAVYPICAFEKAGTKTSPGKACWARACQTSKDRGASYLYVYEGYGPANAYKAASSGFEWWDGTRWSDNRNLYLECLRDDITS
jgi:hypothetical protein